MSFGVPFKQRSMKRSRQRHLLFISIALLALSSLIQGCESAESFAAETGVEPGEGGGSNNGNNADIGGGGTGGNGTGGGGTNNSNDPTFNQSSVVAFTLSPENATISPNEPRKRFTVPKPLSGYVYTWELDNDSIGELTPDSSVSNGTAYYYQGTEFPAGGAKQNIFVVGKRSGSNVRHEGRATVTHQAP